MRRTFSALLVLWFAASLAQAQVPTSNVIYRVLKIKTPTNTGSAFTIEVDGKQYLITARHLLEGFGSEGDVDLWMEQRWSRVHVRAIYPAKESVDIAALDAGRPVTVTFPLEATAGGLTLGQQVYFLGFPFGLGVQGPAPPPGFGELPFLKSGIVSAMDDRDPEAGVLYLDGQNNPGFSGRPIVFWHSESRRFRVAGVVRGYRNEALPVLKKKNLDDPRAPAHNDLYTRANSGIVIGYDIRHIVDGIRPGFPHRPASAFVAAKEGRDSLGRSQMRKPAEQEIALRIILVGPPSGVVFCLQRGRADLASCKEALGEPLSFDFTLRVHGDRASGRPNLRGDFAQGPPAVRFVYVNSGTLAGQAGSCWTRRAKVPLAGITWELIEEALAKPGTVLEARIPGTAKDGGPVCASVALLGGEWRTSPG